MMPLFLELRESPIHGLGVFTSQDLKKGTKIGAFTGEEEISWTEFIQKYGRDYRYCYLKQRHHKILVSKKERCFITWINDGKYKQDIPKVNVKISRGYLYATEDIKKNEELLLDYGKLYNWNL